MRKMRWLRAMLAFAAAVVPVVASAEPAGHITGVGGVFLKSKNPKALMAWYRDVLGIPLEKWGGASLPYAAAGHPPAVILNAFSETTAYFEPSQRDILLNFAVDDLAAFLDRLKAKGVTVLKRDDTDPSGKFAWILDPDGTKIELWEPKRQAAAAP
jgi:predicted enzyme related to lactoylglutathione lyase